jgi:histidinol-phosphate aminotransferase
MQKAQLTRRQFIQHIGCSAAMLGFGAHMPMAFANTESVLPFRKNAAPLWLHFNENSLGMSPKALSAAKLATEQFGNRYPDEAYEQFKQQLAIHHGVEPEQLIFGNGSTEVIQAIVAYAAKQNAVVVEPNPTFGALRSNAQAEGLKVIRVPVGKSFEIDIEAMKKHAMAQKGAVLINLCNPNNPTGNIVSHKIITDWLKSAPQNHLFLLDEAYYDYAQNNPNYKSGFAYIQQGMENVVITRTFSKVHGMAGLRIGYGIANKVLANKINPFAAGFNLNIGGIAAASAALADKAFYAASIESNQQAKIILTTALDELSLPYIPSEANFVLHKLGAPLDIYSNHMQRNGIKVGRKMTADPYWNRISLGTPIEMQAFVNTLLAFRQRGWV